MCTWCDFLNGYNADLEVHQFQLCLLRVQNAIMAEYDIQFHCGSLLYSQMVFGEMVCIGNDGADAYSEN